MPSAGAGVVLREPPSAPEHVVGPGRQVLLDVGVVVGQDPRDVGLGLGLVPGLIVDQHFAERGRMSRLLGDAAIIRHRGKIEAAIANARATLALREAGTPLDALMWEYRDAPDATELPAVPC